MASLGGVNIYIWYLMLVVSPIYPHSSADADAADRADAIAEEQRRLGDAASLRKTAVATVDHDTQTDDPEWLHSALAERGGAGAASTVGTSAVRISMGGGGAVHGVGGGADLLDAGSDGHVGLEGEVGGAEWK